MAPSDSRSPSKGEPLAVAPLTVRPRTDFHRTVGTVIIDTLWPFIFDLDKDILLVRPSCCEGNWAWAQDSREISCSTCERPVPIPPGVSWAMRMDEAWTEQDSGQREALAAWLRPFMNPLDAVLMAGVVDDELVKIRGELGW